MRSARDVSAIWFWPWTMAQTNMALFETFIEVPTVLGARLPMTSNAMQNPWTSDSRELTRMVTEKTSAFGRSQRTLSSTADKLQTAAEGNARDLGKITGGGMLWPSDYVRMAERNLSAWAALATFPGEALAPIHKGVTANARRLGRRSKS